MGSFHELGVNDKLGGEFSRTQETEEESSGEVEPFAN